MVDNVIKKVDPEDFKNLLLVEKEFVYKPTDPHIRMHRELRAQYKEISCSDPTGRNCLEQLLHRTYRIAVIAHFATTGTLIRDQWSAC